MSRPIRIMFVEDSADDVELACRQLTREGIELESRAVDSEQSMRRALAEFRPQLLLSDYTIPGFSGLAALRLAGELAPEVPFIFVSGTIGEDRAVECLRQGAIDYVLKSNLRRLGPAVRRALREKDLRSGYEARIRYMAHFDALTGLPNRDLLGDRVAQAMAHSRRSGRAVALLSIDLDRFKLVNEGFGHAAGNEVLREIGSRLRGALRDGDTVARLGADEFVVLLGDLERSADADAAARKLLEAMNLPVRAAGREFHIRASIGAALCPDDGADFELLLRNAGTALHRVKARGGGGFQYYSAGMTAEALDRIELERGLKEALERGSLQLHFQPVYRLDGRRPTGVEALLRWFRGDGESVSPSRFIPLAEEAGLIGALGEWALENACRTVLDWGRSDVPRPRVCVNVSPRQLQGNDFVALLERVLGSSGLPAARLELELTEGALMESGAAAQSALAELKALGVTIAIDDFGTGYSSLAYLSRLPIDRLKVDRAFVHRMTNERQDAAIVQAVVSLGHALGLEVVAEGVESQQQLAVLEQMGCDCAQGFLFAPPEEATRARRHFD